MAAWLLNAILSLIKPARTMGSSTGITFLSPVNHSTKFCTTNVVILALFCVLERFKCYLQ
jgi:hypothetical protein